MFLDSRPSQRVSQLIRAHGMLILLMVVVLLLSAVAFSKPISQGHQADPTTPVVNETPEGEVAPELTVTPEVVPFEESPMPEEIGYTDGIIFCSTVLVLILLVGTLRETVRRKGR